MSWTFLPLDAGHRCPDIWHLRAFIFDTDCTGYTGFFVYLPENYLLSPYHYKSYPFGNVRSSLIFQVFEGRTLINWYIMLIWLFFLCRAYSVWLLLNVRWRMTRFRSENSEGQAKVRWQKLMVISVQHNTSLWFCIFIVAHEAFEGIAQALPTFTHPTDLFCRITNY